MQGTELSQVEFNTEPEHYNLYELKELGFIDEQKFNELTKQQEANRLELIKKHEIESLKKLKEKYPNV